MVYLHEAPSSRRLRILTFDPSLATMLETASINQITLPVVWEQDLKPGPIGEYIEVVDYDPASEVGYQPVDLNDPHLLAQDGVVPSESNPQFHQQMVYAVAMTTINQFERALGRVAFWADRKWKTREGEYRQQFVRRLRIYPHAIRDRNAYYSPVKKSILFGYFPVTTTDANNTPGTIVFTCLSHDIIAHEVTHALLDGVHPRFNEPTNPDVHAFHEAFADIVALFQHFSYSVVLENQISKTKGDLQTENMLSQLAQQFGRATGRGAALRDALGGPNKDTGKWEPRQPDPHALINVFEAHARGAILVAAVFRAFLVIYRSRTADLFRIAAGPTGRLPEGDLHPDLTKRLAVEAAKCADRILQMCIRGIDYCPPVDITFGDFLRAVITADLDYSPDDEGSFRIAFIQSFREWGIYPRGVKSLGVDALAWKSGDELMRNMLAASKSGYGTLGSTEDQIKSEELGYKTYLKENFLSGTNNWNLESDRFEVWKSLQPIKAILWQWLRGGDHYGQGYAKLFGLEIYGMTSLSTVYQKNGEATVEVHAVRPAVRRTIRGTIRTDLVIEITQRRRGYFDKEEQVKMDSSPEPLSSEVKGDFTYRSGCTILIDPTTQEIRRVIKTPGTITNNDELERVRRFLCGEMGISGNAFDSGLALSLRAENYINNSEPFAMLHQEQED